MARYLIKYVMMALAIADGKNRKRTCHSGSYGKTLEIFDGKKTSLIAAGRTDAGVHSLGQYAHFDYSGSMQEKQLLLAF